MGDWRASAQGVFHRKQERRLTPRHRILNYRRNSGVETGFAFMRTNIPEKLFKIVQEIDENGNASLTRLTVLKKWLERPERLSAFVIWVVARAVSRKGKRERSLTDIRA